jgi:hypothetical protein
MSSDYPGAEEHFVPDSFMFNTNSHSAIVIHKTGGDATPQAVYNTFMASGRSVHYAIGLDGAIWQFVPETRGAGGNCCVEPGYNTFWQPFLDQYKNLNLCTLSVEHCDPTPDNSTPMPQAQVETSYKLVQHWCQKYHIAIDHIHGHASINPINRARCPGATYDFQALFSFLRSGGNMSGIPSGWHDDGKTLTAPNGHRVVLGFRDFILNHPWDPSDMLLEEEVYPNPLEESNPSLGVGSQQVFNLTMLEYTRSKGVFVAYVGQELQFVREDRSKLRTQLATSQQQLTTLQAGLPVADIANAIASLTQLQKDISVQKKA